MTTMSLPEMPTVEAVPVRRDLRTKPGRWPLGGRLLLTQAALSVVAGSLHALGWLYPGMWYAVWGAQITAIALAAISRPKAALVSGSIVGVIGIGLSFYWGVAALQQTFDASPVIAWAIFAVLVAIEAAAFGVFACIVSLAARRGSGWMWLAPCAWVAVEHWFPGVFPWRMGYSQLEVIPLLQIAELIGPTGIGFVMTAAAAIPAVLWIGYRRQATTGDRGRAVRFAISAAVLLAATLLYGSVRQRQWNHWCAQQPKLKVALIQVDPAYTGFDQKLRERSLAVHQDVDVLFWPESALGIYSEKLKNFRDVEQTLLFSRDSPESLEPAKGLACHLLAGGKLYREGAGDEGPISMAAFLISPAQDILGRYRKRTLLPFGEYIPLQAWFPGVREWATLHDVVEAGKDPAPLLTSDGHRLGLVICYEDTLPRNARQTVAAGAEALVSIIQGTAFENPLTLVQHQRLAALRAVENRRYFVRCASTGVTCIISPTGQIVAQLPPQTEGTLVSEIALISGRTLYNRVGDVFPIICTLILGVALIWPRIGSTHR